MVPTPGDDLVELAERAVAEGADVIGMAGGDGSQALVAAVAVRHGLPFVCVPTRSRMMPRMLGPGAPPAGVDFAGPDGVRHTDAPLVLASDNPYRLRGGLSPDPVRWGRLSGAPL